MAPLKVIVSALAKVVKAHNATISAKPVLFVPVAARKIIARRISGILKLIEEGAKPHEHVEFSDLSRQSNLTPHVWVGAGLDCRVRPCPAPWFLLACRRRATCH